MTQQKTSLKNILINGLTFFRFLIISVIIGVLGGLVGVAFHLSVEYATELRLANSWIIYLLPLGGIAIAGLYKLTKLEGYGTDGIISSVRHNGLVPILLAPIIFISTVITHLCGGSAGREGAALQLGGSIGGNIGKLFKFDKRDMYLATLCGMSAVFSALFGTPLTATLFAIEVVSIGTLYYSAIVPCLTAGLVAYKISLLFGIAPVRFTLNAIPQYSYIPFFKVALLALLCALLSIAFCLIMPMTHKWAEKLFKNSYLRGAVGGLIIIVLTLIFGRDYNGAGMGVITNAINGNTVPNAFLLKIVFTAITVGFGFKGGEIVPTFFIGATFGCFIGPIIGLDAGFCAAIALIALFCGNVNSPITSILLSVEMFGAQGLLYFALACAISYALSGNFGLYGSQKIVYSKLRNEYINANTIQKL